MRTDENVPDSSNIDQGKEQLVVDLLEMPIMSPPTPLDTSLSRVGGFWYGYLVTHK